MAILLLGVFTILYWRKRKITGAKGCHCFGHHSWLNQMPIYRNGTLVILLAVHLILPHRPPGGFHQITLFL
uniref:MauE/DoxX family redox-associated membrane protein n=1 Tax=unclassified Paenibacillus TaxID=185978 RepID=UPI00403E4251